MVVSGDPLGCKMGLMIGDIALGGNGYSVYRIDETRNLVFCYSPVPSTSSSGTDINVCSESCRLPGNGYERPTAKPMNDIVASIKIPSHCARHLSARVDFKRCTESTRCSR